MRPVRLLRLTTIRVRSLAMVLLLASVPLFAGCLEASGAALDEARAKVGLPPDEVPARSVADEAADEAAAWDAAAVLVGITGVERAPPPEAEGGANESTDGNESGDVADGPQIADDPDVGNGKAPAWFFRFESERGALEIQVNADGSIAHREEQPREKESGAESGDGSSETATFEGPYGVGDWPVNSHEAWDLVAENATWTSALDGVTPMMAFSTLLPLPEDLDGGADDESMDGNASTMEPPALVARWLLLAINETGNGAGALVNAVNGTVEEVFPWEPFQFEFEWDWGGWNGMGGGGGMGGGWTGEVVCCEGEPSFDAEFAGQVTILEPTMRHEVPVTFVGELVFIELQASTSLTGSGVELRLLDESDEEVPLEQSGFMNFGSFNSGTTTFVGYPPGPGAYTLEVSITTLNALVDYSTHVQVGMGTMAPEEDNGRATLEAPALPLDALAGALR